MKKSHFLAAAGLFPAALQPAAAAVVYTETFTHASTGNVLPSGVGWSGYFGSNATAITGAASGDRGGSSSGNGPDGSKGYLFTANGTTANLAFALVENTFATVTANTITWQMGNSSASISVRLLIKQGANWYATTGTFSTAAFADAAAFASGPALQTFVFSLSAASWQNFTLDPGNTLALGAVLTSDLASNQIDGIGFYVEHNTSPTSTMRIDNLTINDVPEPSTTLLTAASGLGILALRRRTARR